MAQRPSTSGKTASSTRSVNMPIIIGAAIIVIALIGGLGWHYFGPQTSSTPAKPLSTAEQANWAWMKQAAAKTNGDILKLSPDDQRRVYTIIGPRAPFEFLTMAHKSGQ
jgi:hypothetical protein